MTPFYKIFSQRISNAGYADDFSKSNNALDAEASGRFPATELGKRLGVSPKFIKLHAPKSGEWHHSSKFYNPVEYYNHDDVREWLDSDEGKNAHEDFKKQESQNKETPSQAMHGASIKYLEWGGTRNHPVATEKEEHGVHIEQKPGQAMVTITRPDGSSFKKKLDTKGFEIKGQDGKHFYADYVFKKESQPHHGRGNWGHAGNPGHKGGSSSSE